MTFHVNRSLQRRAALYARQATTLTISKGTSTTRVTTSSSTSSRPRDTSASISGRSTSTSISSTTTSSRPVSSSSSSSLISTSQTSKSGIVVPPTTTTTTTSSSSSVSSSVPTAKAAATTTRKNGSLAGVIIGILVAILVIILVIVFIFKRVRKRRDRVDDARFFNKEKLQRPGMVQGIAAGPGVNSLNGSENEKDSQLHNIEGSLPASAYPFNTPQHRGITNLSPSPYGTGDPAFHSGSSYSLNGGQQEWGAPPIPGHNGPAPYSPYMATFSNYGHPNQSTPPGSPFVGGNSMQNPFATPSGTDTHPSTPTSATWPHTPMGAHHLPLLSGGAFTNDSFRDSGYSAAYSDVHVGQAYKVQVGLSMPKYEDLTTTTTTTKDAPGSPPPAFTPFDPTTTVNNAEPAYTDPVATVDNAATAATHKSLPPRPVSTHTIYNPEDAYGGV